MGAYWQSSNYTSGGKKTMLACTYGLSQWVGRKNKLSCNSFEFERIIPSRQVLIGMRMKWGETIHKFNWPFSISKQNVKVERNSQVFCFKLRRAFVWLVVVAKICNLYINIFEMTFSKFEIISPKFPLYLWFVPKFCFACKKFQANLFRYRSRFWMSRKVK